RDMDDIRRKLEPVEREVRRRIGNFILAEDEQTLEGGILRDLQAESATLWRGETFTSGQMAARLAHLPGADAGFRRGTVPRALPGVWAAGGPPGRPPAGPPPPQIAETVARAARPHTGASHALSVLIDLDDGPDRIEFGGTICL